MCKGKRYERFMVEGKLLGNKRDMKLTQHHKELLTKPNQETPPFNLETTIKRLAERTKVKIDYEEEAATKLKVITVTFKNNVRLSVSVIFRWNAYEPFQTRRQKNKRHKSALTSICG